MTNSISSTTSNMAISSNMKMPPPPSRSEQVLTAEQLSLVSETLSKYDSENISQTDAESIVNVFAKSGISPSASLESAMAELGFEAKNIGDLAKSPAEKPLAAPNHIMANTVNSNDLVSFLDELLAQYSDKLADADQETILAALQERFALQGNDSIISIKV